MKYFLSIVLLATVASASYVKPIVASEELLQLQEIVSAIINPNTEPTAIAALQAMLHNILGVGEPVSVGPAIVDFPVPGDVAPVEVDPVVETTLVAAPTAPLVHIIININQANNDVTPVVIDRPVAGPVAVDDVAASPVQVVETAPVSPVAVVETAPVAPVTVVETAPVAVQPVQVVETAPVAEEPVLVGTPIIVAPAGTLPEQLN